MRSSVFSSRFWAVRPRLSPVLAALGGAGLGAALAQGGLLGAVALAVGLLALLLASGRRRRAAEPPRAAPNPAPPAELCVNPFFDLLSNRSTR